MPQDGNPVFWAVLIVAMVVFLFLPQFMARRRQQKREEELQVGDAVVTIGGFLGELTYIDFEANIARLRLAEGIEVRVLPEAIRGKRATPVSTAEDDAAYEVPETPDSEG